jgi:hypothetical protein
MRNFFYYPPLYLDCFWAGPTGRHQEMKRHHPHHQPALETPSNQGPLGNLRPSLSATSTDITRSTREKGA